MESSNFNLIPKIVEDNGDGLESMNAPKELYSVVASAQSCQDTMHPLLLPPVMLKFFKNLTHRELATCRQVCREWRDESMSIWRSTSAVELYNWGTTSEAKCVWARYDKSTIPEVLKEFLEFHENPSNKCHLKQYGNFTLSYWALGLDSNKEPSAKLREEQLLVDRFWQQVGTHITSLSIKVCSFLDIDDVRKLMYVACPNLQHLVMRSCHVKPNNYNEDDTFRSLTYEYPSNEAASYMEPKFGEHIHMRSLTLKNCLPDSWLQILSHFSSLTTLNISGFTTYPELNTPELLKAVQAIRQSCSHKVPLRNVSPLGLDKEGSTSQVNFDLLLEFGFPLGEMRTSLSDGVDYNFLSSALRNHAETLTTLVVCPNPDHSLRLPSRLELQHVKEFHLRFGLLENFYFLDNLPNLEVLVLTTWSDGSRSRIAPMFANTSELEVADLILPKVKKLELDYEMTEKNLRRLAQWLPNVEELEIPLDDKLLRVVCENWKDLVKLTDESNQITDEGVIGVALGNSEVIITPAVALLKRLERFKSSSDRLTWTAVDGGFGKMSSLNYLDIPLMATTTVVTSEKKDEFIGKGAFKLMTQVGEVWVLPTD